MKKIKIIIFHVVMICMIFTVAGQAHIGLSEYELKKKYPTNKWITGYTVEGTKYISTDMFYGNYNYYFNQSNRSYFVMNVPYNLVKLNAQIEVYNNKYVITSDISWTAYLEDDGIMYITLLYDKSTKLNYFIYSSTKP